MVRRYSQTRQLKHNCYLARAGPTVSSGYLKKKTGKFNGWLSYTLSKTERKIEGINNGDGTMRARIVPTT